MRILHTVEFYRPSTGGAQEVVRQISERLARRGHDVTVATTALPERGRTRIAGVEIAEFEVAGSEAGGLRGDIEGYRRFVTGADFDVVLWERIAEEYERLYRAVLASRGRSVTAPARGSEGCA